jgi:NADPH2:quinone reductase
MEALMGNPRALIVDEYGPVENYQLRAHEIPAPGPAEVQIRVRAAGVGFVDTLLATGRYQIKLPLPCIPGIECAGIVEAVGEGVTHVRPGDRVMASHAKGGAYADIRNVPADKTLPLPDNVSFASGAVFRLNYTTAYYALKQRGNLQKGETLLVLGASGGVGYAAIEIGKALGAYVIASASNEDKRALARKGGADAVVDSNADDWREQVKSANGGKPVDVIIDPVGGEATERAFRSLAWGGRHLMIGFAAGDIPCLPANLPLLKGASLIGVDVHQFVYREPEASNANLEDLLAMLADGKLNPPIDRAFPLTGFAVAMRHVDSGKSVGRVVLEMQE